jgi:hypothetical protein
VHLLTVADTSLMSYYVESPQALLVAELRESCCSNLRMSMIKASLFKSLACTKTHKTENHRQTSAVWSKQSMLFDADTAPHNASSNHAQHSCIHIDMH